MRSFLQDMRDGLLVHHERANRTRADCFLHILRISAALYSIKHDLWIAQNGKGVTAFEANTRNSSKARCRSSCFCAGAADSANETSTSRRGSFISHSRKDVRSSGSSAITNRICVESFSLYRSYIWPIIYLIRGPFQSSQPSQVLRASNVEHSS